MDIDALFISKLLDTSQEEFRETVKIIPDEYIQGIERHVYSFIKKYYRESKGKMPTPIAVKKKFPDFKRVKASDSLHYYRTELRNRSEYETFTRYITSIQDNLFNKDIDKAKENFHGLGIDIAKHSLHTTETARTGFSDRRREYNKIKSGEISLGYKTGIPLFDKHIGGITDEFFAVVGKRGVGKTFLLLLMMANIWKQVNNPVVFVSNEMGLKKILKRVDSVVGRFNSSRYRKGQLTQKEEIRLKKLPKLYKKLSELYVINGAGKSVDEIEYELISLEPSLLCVDGLYLTNMGFNDPYRDTLAASRAYQRISQRYSLPTIATSQLNDDEVTKYARAVEEDADIVLRMRQPPALKTDKVMKIDFLKIREEDGDIINYLEWNFDKWSFKEIDYDTADESQEQEFEAN